MANNRNIHGTNYSQEEHLTNYPNEAEFQKVPNGFCMGIATIDIINFLQKKNKPYPLENLNDAKEAARQHLTYREAWFSGNKNFAEKQIKNSGNVVTLFKKRNTIQKPSKKEVSEFIYSEFEKCRILSKPLEEEVENTRCAKLFSIEFKKGSGHALSLKVEGASYLSSNEWN